jgi:hypothetical protein
MAVFPAVTGYSDGYDQKVNADVLNKPIIQLKERTDYLLDMLNELLGSGKFESVRFNNVQVSPERDECPGDYEIVCMDAARMRYVKAKSSAVVDATYPYACAGERSFVVGVMTGRSASNCVGTVVAYGKLDLTGVLLRGMLEPGEVFRNGPYYVSATHAGKMTAKPEGPAVHIGFFAEEPSRPGYGGVALLAPQLKDLSEAHLHRSFIISGSAAGAVEVDGGYHVRGLPVISAAEGAPRLRLSGSWASTAQESYVVWYTSASGSISDARLSWKLSGAPDSTAVAADVSEFFETVPVGGYGLMASLEPSQAWSAFNLADGSLPISLSRSDACSWNVTAPEAAAGWTDHVVPGLPMSYNGTAAPKGFRLFGRYANPLGSGAVSFSLTRASSSYTLRANGDVLAEDLTPGSAPLRVAADLWLFHTPVAVGGQVADGDVWTLDWSDPAPGATYKYNKGFDVPLAAHYPPEPLSGLSLELNGVALAARGEFGTGTGEYVPASDSLYWYGASLDTLPWRQGDSAQRNFKIRFNTGSVAPYGFVTSLRPSIDSGVTLRDCRTGEPAATGDLEISAELKIETEAGDEPGCLVFKDVSARGRLLRGPVVERVVAGPGLTLRGSDPARPGQGVLEIGLADAGISSGSFDDVTLLNAKQELTPGGMLLSYYKLLPWDSSASRNIPSGLVAKMRVPYSLSGQYRIVFYLTMFGLDTIPLATATPQYAGLSLSWCLAPDFRLPTDSAPALVRRSVNDLTQCAYESAKVVNVPFGVATSPDGLSGGYTAYDLMLAHTDPSMLPVDGQVSSALFGSAGAVPQAGKTPAYATAGDVLTLKVERCAPSGTSSAYTPAVGIVDMKWRLIPTI